MLAAGHWQVSLNVQYRMHPAISRFPNQFFYGGQLEDAPDIRRGSLFVPELHCDRRFQPFLFFDVRDSREHQARGSTSFANQAEAAFVRLLLETLVTRKWSVCQRLTIGVITPYRDQQQLLRSTITEYAMSQADPRLRKVLDAVDVRTIDGFQGQQRDIVIFSVVRSSPQHMGFLTDFRRMNVALTRARVGMYVVGSRQALAAVQPHWSALVESATNRKLVYRVRASTMRSFARREKSVSIPAGETGYPGGDDAEPSTVDTVSSAATAAGPVLGKRALPPPARFVPPRRRTALLESCETGEAAVVALAAATTSVSAAAADLPPPALGPVRASTVPALSHSKSSASHVRTTPLALSSEQRSALELSRRVVVKQEPVAGDDVAPGGQPAFPTAYRQHGGCEPDEVNTTTGGAGSGSGGDNNDDGQRDRAAFIANIRTALVNAARSLHHLAEAIGSDQS